MYAHRLTTLCQHAPVLLAYLDESFTKTRYYMAALIVDGDQAGALSDALDDVIWKAITDHSNLHPRAELHGHDIFAGKKDWARLAPKIRARIGVYDDALQAIAQHAAAVIFRGVDVERLNRRYSNPDHPHSIVLTHLIERIDEFAEERAEHALMIADEVSNQADHRRSLYSYQKGATWGWRSRQITRVIDTLHFAPSSSSRLVQAADLLAFLYRRTETHVETDQRAAQANAVLFGRVEPLIYHRGTWLP